MKKKQQYDILSPDGFSIDPSKTYDSPEKAIKALKKWKKRFKEQGYYSSNNGRIDLLDLEESCELIDL